MPTPSQSEPHKPQEMPLRPPPDNINEDDEFFELNKPKQAEEEEYPIPTQPIQP